MDFSKLNSKEPSVKYPFAKELTAISKSEPEKLYPHFDEIEKMMHSEKKVLFWNALKIMGNLASVDSNNMIEKVLPDIIAVLNQGNMISANNAIEALGKIALAKRQFLELIIDNLLRIESYKYESDECSSIATGKAITVLTTLFTYTDRKDEIKKLAEKHLKSERPATFKKAEELMKKLENEKN